MTDNIAETLIDIAEKYGEKTGLIEVRNGNKLTFSELLEYSDSLAVYLQQNGIKPGDRTMLMVKPSADFICLTFALFKIGAPVILIDPGMGYRNLLRCIENVRPKAFIGIPKAHIFRRLFPQPFFSITNSFCCGFSFGIFGPDIRKKAVRIKKQCPVYNPAPDDLAAIIFTTGSTGPPKGVRYEHAIFATQLKLIKEYYRISPRDVDQPAFPLFALFSIALGACAVIPDMNPARPAKVNPKKFLKSIERYNVTYSFGSPAIWNVIEKYCRKNGKKITSLRQILMAGAPVSGELIGRLIPVLPKDSRIHTPYGATESLPVVSIEGNEIIRETWKLTRTGRGTCVGRPLPGISIKIIEISDRVIESLSETRELQHGEIGEIIVCGGVVTRAYEGNPEETMMAKIQDGNGNAFWHRMGDTGYIDEHGRLWFCGRKAHRVVTQEGVLFSIPCEAIINTHPDVFRSALVGIPKRNERNVKIPVMIIEKKKTKKRKHSDLLKEIREFASRNDLTKGIEHFLFHNDFPVDIRHNAKIFREKLAVWAEQELAKK